MDTLYPTGYGKRLVTIDALFAEHHLDKMHPEYARRLRAWLIAQNGLVGIGGSWRDTGTQPDKPGFAPEGRSFHQYQRFASGRVVFCAVDLVVRNDDGLLKRIFGRTGSSANPDTSTLRQLLSVSKIHRAPHWDEVPVQGSAAAARAGVHCNISTESWHMQPIEIDGWASWIGAGRPDPAAGYPIPARPTPPEVQPPPPPPVEEDDMEVISVEGDTAQYLRQGMFARWIPSSKVKTAWVNQLRFDPAITVLPDKGPLTNLILVGANPVGDGVTTGPADFGGHIA